MKNYFGDILVKELIYVDNLDQIIHTFYCNLLSSCINFKILFL